MTLTMTLDEYRAQADKPKRSKYNNRRVQIGGYVFDSKAEARRYETLAFEQAAGLITGLDVHPSFVLQPAFKDSMGKKNRAITYEADFRYKRGGVEVVEDVKGARTGVFNMKLKMLKYTHPDVNLVLIPAKAA